MALKKTGTLLALGSAAALGSMSAHASDKELLDALYENGVLNKAQYESLIKKVEEKEAAAPAAGMSEEKEKALKWATKIKVGGDMRARYENVDNEEEIKKNRQRIRARLKVKAEVNDEVEAGFRLVTTGGRTSTNKSLGDGEGKASDAGFAGKAVFFDRAYITWTPNFFKGSSLTVGKFKQPWFRVTDNVWDSDVNPEGLSLSYTHDLGPAELTATGGYYILSDNGEEGHTFSEDLNMYHGGLSGTMKFSDAVKASIGGNAYLYNNNDPVNVNRFAGDRVNGDTNVDFKIYEVAGKIDIDTGILPIKLFANYATNAADNVAENEDEAWMAGIGTKWNKFKMEYNYRDTQKNAVPDTFNDSDFARGATGARGHKIKLAYELSKHFSLGGAYLAAEDYVAEPGKKINVDTFQVDLKAKF